MGKLTHDITLKQPPPYGSYRHLVKEWYIASLRAMERRCTERILLSLLFAVSGRMSRFGIYSIYHEVTECYIWILFMTGIVGYNILTCHLN